MRSDTNKMIDNIELIKPILNFEKEGDFYMLYVFLRKKDFPEQEQKNHQSVRTIKTYCVDSIQYLESRYDEIKGLCEYFGARAYIHIQKQNHNDVSLNMMVELAQRIQSGQNNQKGLFDSVVGQIKTLEKRWVVDIDTKDEDFIFDVCSIIDGHCQPFIQNPDHEVVTDGTFYLIKNSKYLSKVKAFIPTKNGVHLITDRFDVQEFKKHYPEIDIQKKNPTLLYLPDKLFN